MLLLVLVVALLLLLQLVLVLVLVLVQPQSGVALFAHTPQRAPSYASPQLSFSVEQPAPLLR